MQDDLTRTRVSANPSVLPSSISVVDGADGGTLRLRGYPFQELVERASYEEVAWLLWTGEAPSPAEAQALHRTIGEGAAQAAAVLGQLAGIPADAAPLARLQAALPLVPYAQPDSGAWLTAANPMQAALLAGAFAAIAARAAAAETAPAEPAATAALFADGVASGFLALARGAPAPSDQVSAFQQVLIVFAEHEFNASTFAARVAASTRASMLNCVLAALSTLSGPLHGGVERHVRRMLAAAADEGAEHVVERYERAGQAIPGFGHAVYRSGDPRAVVMRRLAETLALAAGQERLYELTREIEEVAGWRRLPRANVDLYTTVVYRALGIPDALSTLVFATARVAGWCAHVLEQYEHNRLIRPRAEYQGLELRHWPAPAP